MRRSRGKNSGFLLWKPNLGRLALALATVILSLSSVTIVADTALVTKANKKKKLGLFFAAQATTNRQPIGDVKDSSYVTLTAIPSYKLPYKLTVSARADLTRELTDATTERKWRLDGEPSLRLSHAGFKLNDTFTVKPGVRFYMGVSESALDDTTFQYGVLGLASLNADLKTIGLSGLTVDYTMYARTNKHAQQVAQLSTNSNSQYNWNHLISATYAFSKKLSLELSFYRAFGFSYQGSQSDSFIIGQELAFQTTPKLGITFGLSTGGSVLAADQSSSNLSLLDDDLTELYLGANYTF